MSEWQDIKTAPKDMTPVLLALKNPLPAPGRDDLKYWHGVFFVGRHPGVCEDGFDSGWNFAGPVGMGGFPDAWIAGWQPLPEPPQAVHQITNPPATSASAATASNASKR